MCVIADFIRHGAWMKGLALASFALPWFLGLGSRNLAAAPEEATVLEQGLVFGKGGDLDLKLDLARPAQGKGPFPGLVWVFGGGWGYFNAARAQCPIRTAAEQGFVAVTVDYRLTSARDAAGKVRYPFPAQIQDVKCAIRWLRAHAGQYHVDPERIGIVGWSSGGHLALLAGLAEAADGLEGDGGQPGVSSRVKAVVCSAGMVDAVSFHQHTNVPLRVELLLGGPPDAAPAAYRAASPLSYVRKTNPPVLFLQGDQDSSCPPAQAQMLKDGMDAAGADCTVIIEKGKGHQDFYTEPALWQFLDKHLKPS